MTQDRKIRIKPIPEIKKNAVKILAEKMKSSRTILIASTKSLPASQFQKIKSKIRKDADIVVAKKSIVDRALKDTGKGSLLGLKEHIGADIALIFSNIESFELAGILVDSQTASKARIGDICPEDIVVEEGPTDLMPGPAISELGAVGLKVAVDGGKLAIKKSATIAKKGDVVSDKLASVLGKLKIFPMSVGFIPIAAYDSQEEKIYVGIKIDKKGALEALREAIGKALGFAVSVGYFTQQTVKFFIAKAGLQEKALSAKLDSGAVTEDKPVAEAPVEKKEVKEEPKAEEKKDE